MKVKKKKDSVKNKKILAIVVVVVVFLLGLSFVPFFPKFMLSKCPDWSYDRAVNGFVNCPGEANFWQYMSDCITYRNVDGACKLAKPKK